MFNNIWSILLPCAQMLGQYVMKIPGVGGLGGVVTVEDCGLGDVLGGVELLVTEEG